jgi:hypothetical protein
MKQYTTDQRFFQMLLKVYVWLLQRAYGLNLVKTGEIKMNYVVKNDNPDVGLTIDIGEVTDAEGEVLSDDSVTVEVTSSNPGVVQVGEPDEDGLRNVHFGTSGQAAVVVNAKGPNGEILATGGDNFTVTPGDPAAVSGISTSFEGLTPIDEPPVE